MKLLGGSLKGTENKEVLKVVILLLVISIYLQP